jgi:hypothetical protein
VADDDDNARMRQLREVKKLQIGLIWQRGCTNSLRHGTCLIIHHSKAGLFLIQKPAPAMQVIKLPVV